MDESETANLDGLGNQTLDSGMGDLCVAHVGWWCCWCGSQPRTIVVREIQTVNAVVEERREAIPSENRRRGRAVGKGDKGSF